MLRQLIEAWRGESLQKRMLDEFDEMLACDERMYELASEALLHPETIDAALNEVRQLDELARSMVPGYAPLDSEDMAKLNEASAMSARMMEENDG